MYRILCTSCINIYGPVMTWKHFSALPIHWSSVDSLHKGPVIQGFGVLFDVSTNKLSRVAGVIWDAWKLIYRLGNVERTVTYHTLWPTCQNKQRVLMHEHQGWNVRHGLCHIYMIYVYIWVVYSFCLFCCLFIIVTTQFVALYKPCKPKPKPSTYDPSPPLC